MLSIPCLRRSPSDHRPAGRKSFSAHRFEAEVESLEGRQLLSSILASLPNPPQQLISTIPANGDVNPYGVAYVPKGFPGGGPLKPGDVLVANFNNSQNLQGTGTTIVDVTPGGQLSTFFQGKAGLGLDTGLAVLKRGFIIVANLPTTDGTSATAQPGSLLVLDRFGHVLANVANSSLLNGPWDLTVDDRGSHADLFVSNVLSGAVTRIDLAIPEHGDHIMVESATQIASGYAHRGDPAALELGPTGLAFDAAHDTLYVASTLDNKIFAIPNAELIRHDHGTGTVIYTDNTHLHGPIGLALAPNGNLITANADSVNADPNQQSELVEFTKRGQFVAQLSLDPAMPAAPFGLAINVNHGVLSLAAVNDDTNQLEIFTTKFPMKH